MSNSKVVRLPAKQQIPGIMSELQAAADMLQGVGWGVSVFGSARIRPESIYYQLAEELAPGWPKRALPLSPEAGLASWKLPTKGPSRLAATVSD